MKRIALALTSLFVLGLASSACDFSLIEDAFEDDSRVTARMIIADLGSFPATTTLTDTDLEGAFIAAAEGDANRRALASDLADRGCELGGASAYRSWSDDADYVVVEAAAVCEFGRTITLVTYLEADRPVAVASCYLTGEAGDGMLYHVTDAGRIHGAPRS